MGGVLVALGGSVWLSAGSAVMKETNAIRLPEDGGQIGHAKGNTYLFGLVCLELLGPLVVGCATCPLGGLCTL